MNHKTYVTFGQSHVHSIAGKTFDKNTVAVIPCTDTADGRRKAFEIFGPKFCMKYFDSEFNQKWLEQYNWQLVNIGE